MRNKIITAVVLALGLTLVPSAATATECVPSDAWTETVEHPAQNTETIEVVDVPAWTEVIEHEATYATEHEYIKQVKGNVQERKRGTWETIGAFDWENWTGATPRWEATGFSESGPHSAVQWQQGNDRKVSTHYRYEPTGQTRQGALLTEAWTEVIEHAATYKTVANPDYVAAWTETIEHPAVVCEPPTEPEPPVVDTPEPPTEPEPEPTTGTATEPEAPTPPATPARLADTGVDGSAVLAALALLLIGSGVALRRRFSTSN